MALKGSATIELTNADGTKEVIKHDNMITNAVADLCFSQRGDMAAILKMTNNNDSYAQAMFGGVLLFDEVLNSDPADYQLPTTKVTGYASQDAYAGLDLARGSFNQAEGGVQPDGSYKFVWDFSTSQGNGRIQSIALCPNVMGKIGASDTIVSSERADFYFSRGSSAPFHSSGYMLDSNGSTNGISNYNYTIVAIDGDIAYAADYRQIKYYNSNSAYTLEGNGGILKLHKFKLGSTAISLADRVGMARYIECVDVQLPSTFVNNLGAYDGNNDLSFYYNSDHKILTVSPCRHKANIAANGEVYYVDIELSNSMNVTLHTFKNTTPGYIQWNISMYDDFFSFYALKDYIIVVVNVDSKYKMYIVDRADNTNIKEVTLAGEPFYQKYGIARYILCEKNVLVFGYNNSNSSSAEYYTYIVDLSTGIAKGTNAKYMHALRNLEIGSDSIRIMTGSYLTYNVIINPFILTTKNNLDSPVTKTASQTMKITYTLSEV